MERSPLRWKAKWTDKTFGAHLTSDGSLRFFALVTLLNLPPAMLPDVILLDEPELGLHPTAIELVAHMVKALAQEKQTIVATQSPLLVDAFGLDEIIVLDLKDGKIECLENLTRMSSGYGLNRTSLRDNSGRKTFSGDHRDSFGHCGGGAHRRSLRQETILSITWQKKCILVQPFPLDGNIAIQRVASDIANFSIVL